MKYITDFQSPEIFRNLVQNIKAVSPNQPIFIMEVCGTHTMSIHRHAIPQLLPDHIKLVSGPGCPVCVTATGSMNAIIALCQLKNMVICTFGDMIRVPGSHSSLENERALGKDIRIVYSPLDVLEMAEKEPQKLFVFVGIGFETTAPAVGVAILEAHEKKIKNFYVACLHKTMPQALKTLVKDEELQIDAFICPAHVSTIIGAWPYQFLVDEYNKACVIAGFEPADILQGIYMLCKQLKNGKSKVEIQYNRVVKNQGNTKALQLLNEVFEPCDDNWRGFGRIPSSGLKIRDKYNKFDAFHAFNLSVSPAPEPNGCLCADVIKGKKQPHQCPLFRNKCTPTSPVGACMVSSEGTCAAFYKYSTHELD